MSIQQNLYLGPFAEVPVAPSEFGEDFAERFEGRLRSNSKVSGPARICLMPVCDGIGSPPRECYDWGPCVTEVDVEGIDRAAEVRWLLEEYAAELAELAARMGEPPVVRWGLIAWLS